jgi:hypothetical protein
MFDQMDHAERQPNLITIDSAQEVLRHRLVSRLVGPTPERFGKVDPMILIEKDVPRIRHSIPAA